MSKKNKNNIINIDSDLYDDICLSYIQKYNHEEEWQPIIIDGYVTKYMVSNYGRLKDIYTEESPTIYRGNRHFYTNISVKKGGQRYFGTYRLVAMAFIKIPKKYIKLL